MTLATHQHRRSRFAVGTVLLFVLFTLLLVTMFSIGWAIRGVIDVEPTPSKIAGPTFERQPTKLAGPVFEKGGQA